MDFFTLSKFKYDKQILLAAAGVSVAALAGYSLWQYSRSTDTAPVGLEDNPKRSKPHAVISNKDFELFDAAVAFVSSPPAGCNFDLSNSEKLKLYALFKQATCGPCSAPEPGMLELDFSKHMKWKAWNALGSASKADAAIEYTTRLQSKVPNWRSAAGLSAELQEHVTGTVPDMPANTGAGDDQEQEEQSFDMGPSVSRLDVDALSKEEQELRESKTSDVVLAVEEGDADKTRTALKNSAGDANAKNEFGETALHLAVNSGNAEVVQLLLEAGAQVDTAEEEGGLTPLMYCTFLSDPAQSSAIAQLLVGAGADKTLLSDEGTAYDMAKDAEASEELLQLLRVE